MKIYPPEITQSINLIKEGHADESRALLKNYICNNGFQYDAILWLAKVTPNQTEALAATELAYQLEPTNVIAQRGLAAVHNRTGQNAIWDPQRAIIDFTGMTMEQARAVIWPFRGLNRPMGVLLDEKCLHLKDLAWAIENAHDKQIQASAKTLLLASLIEEKKEYQAEPAKVIQGFDYPGYLDSMSYLTSGIYLGVLISICILYAILLILAGLLHWMPISLANIIAYPTFPLAAILITIALRVIDKGQQVRMGRDGEKKFLDQLRATLRSPWTIYHNLAFPNRKWGDVDFVVYGPGGIWVFEVKAYEKATRNRGDNWQYQSRFGWRNISKHPGLQAKRNAVNVKDYLESHGVNPGWVQAVVIWAGDDDKITVEDPAVPVWKMGEMQDRIEEFWRRGKLSEEQIGKINGVWADPNKKKPK